MNKKIHIYFFFQLIIFNFQFSVTTAQVLSNNGAVLSVTSGAQLSNLVSVFNTSGTIENQGVITITSAITNNATIVGNGTYNIGGNFTNNSVFTASTSTVNLNGIALQTIAGTSITNFENININNATGVTLGTNSTISGVLNFASGVINTGGNKISITSTGAVTGSGSSKFVNGYLEKYIPIGAGVITNFEIGNGNTDYLPLNLNFSNVTGAGYFTGSVNNGDHVDIGNSCLDQTKSVNRNWTLSNTGAVFTNYSINSNFSVADKDGGSNSANYNMAILNGASWNTVTQGALTATSTQGLGVIVVGDIQIGEFKPMVGTPVFALGTTSERCRVAGTVTYSATATNALTITYSLDAASISGGNSINASTGEVTYGSSYTGTSIITATASGCFGPLTATHSAVLTALPVNSSVISGVGCVAIGATQTYSITAVARSSSYVWTVPVGANIISGQGTNMISVNFTAGLVNGFVTVDPQNACGAAVNISSKNVGSGGAPLKPSTVYGSMVVCSYLGVGTVTYSVTPVSGASSYQWAKPSGSTITSGQGTNSITVTFTSSFTSGQFSVTSVNGCASSAFTYFTPNKISTVPVSVTGIANAYGKTNNATLVNYTTPVIDGAISYNWTVPANVTIASGQGSTSVSLTFAPAFTGGNIYVAAVNACGSSSTITKAIANNTTTPLSDLEHYTLQKNVSCNGLKDGEASVKIQGGLNTDTYSYIWNTNPIQTASTASKLSAGTYTVKVTNKSGSSFVEQISIVEPEKLFVKAIKINNSLYGESTGRAIAAASGGSGIYEYLWNTHLNKAMQEANELAAGVYTVTVKDQSNCSASASVIITDSLVDVNASLTSKVFPVPAVNNFMIEYNLIDNRANSVVVISYDGKIVYKNDISQYSESNRLFIDCNAWSRGMYYVFIKDKNEIVLSSKPVVLMQN